MIINKPHLATVLDIWQPKYSSQYTDTEEWVVLLHKSKVHHATPIIIVKFTKAKHLAGQRFAISREKVMRSPETTNGKAAMYAVKMSDLEPYTTPEEVNAEVEGLGW